MLPFLHVLFCQVYFLLFRRTLFGVGALGHFRGVAFWYVLPYVLYVLCTEVQYVRMYSSMTQVCTPYTILYNINFG